MVLLRFSILASLSFPLCLSHTHAYARTFKHTLSLSHTQIFKSLFEIFEQAQEYTSTHTHTLILVTYTNWKTHANTQTYITDTNSPCHTNIDRDRNTVTKSHSEITTQPHCHSATQSNSHTVIQPYSYAHLTFQLFSYSYLKGHSHLLSIPISLTVFVRHLSLFLLSVS